MKSLVFRLFVVGIGVALAVFVAAGSAGLHDALAAPNQAAATLRPTPLPITAPVASVIYRPTGGPFVGEEQASATAARLAKGPITRHVVGLMTYREAADWMRSWTYTVDPGREVYLVINEAPYQLRHGIRPVTCAFYFAVVDATDGGLRADGCKDLGNVWPVLPPSLSGK